MCSFFPGLDEELVTRGAVPGDVIGDCIWFLGGSYKLRFPSGLRGIVLSRPLLEATIRRRVAELPNVTLLGGTSVRGLVTQSDRRVTGVESGGDGSASVEHAADLVVDATGRGSRTPAWLESLGYPRPEEEKVEVGIGYTTLIFPREERDLGGAIAVIAGPNPPSQVRFGVSLAMEGDRWMITLGGFLGDHAPTEINGYKAFAESLSAPDIYQMIRGKRAVSEAATYKFPANLRRRYERLGTFPQGFLVIGDGLTSFNPIYGQGMSVAALQAEALGECLGRADASKGKIHLWRSFFTRASKIADIAWTLAATADLAVEGVKGQKPPGFAAVNWYLGRVQNLASRDEKTCRAFFDVSNLLASPGTMFRPGLAWKVLAPRASARRRQPAASGVS